MYQPIKATAARAFIAGLLFCLLAGGAAGRAQEAAPSEHQVKAAFLYNFAKFVKWPEAALPAEGAPITIGILGDNPFGTDLELAVKDRTINGHPVAVKSVSLAEANHCQVLFICQTPKRNLAEVLGPLKGSGVLTVSETDRFTEAGGMIRFLMEGNKVRFEINDEAAKAAGLTISSKLLNLAWKKEQGR